MALVGACCVYVVVVVVGCKNASGEEAEKKEAALEDDDVGAEIKAPEETHTYRHAPLSIESMPPRPHEASLPRAYVLYQDDLSLCVCVSFC